MKLLLLWVVANDAWGMLDSGKTTDSNHLYGRYWGTYGLGGSRRGDSPPGALEGRQRTYPKSVISASY